MVAFSVANYTADYVYEKKIRPSVVKSVSDIVSETAEKTGQNVNENVDVIWDSMPKYISAFSGIAGIDKEKIRDYIKKCEQGNKAGQIDISKNAITYNNEMIGLIEETDKEIGSVNNE